MKEKEIKKIEEIGFEMIPEKLSYDNDLFGFEGGYEYTIGHSRRGQLYYYIVKNRKLYIKATEADGSGAAIEANPEIIKKLLDNNLIDL